MRGDGPKLWLVACSIAILAACGDDGGGTPADAGPDAGIDAGDAGDGLTTVAVLPAVPNPDLDVLVVVDNSSSMGEEQQALAANFPSFVNALQALPGGLPSLHLGVVSSDVGTGGVIVPSCSSATRPHGDDGNLLTNGCTAVSGTFLSDLRRPDGSRERNYTGDLATVFACMARLGVTGCGFEQPLESVHRALQPARNPGFLRPSALLAVVFLTDEDDCSAMPGGAMFGDPNATVSSPLGPRTSFRCFEFGVACENDPNPRAPGPRTGCVPRDPSPYLEPVSRYVDFLRSLKADPRDVIVAGITGRGEPGRATVEPDPNDATRPALGPACTSAHGYAFPDIRMRAFLDSFPDRNAQATICNDNYHDALDQIGDAIRDANGDPCLEHELADVEPGTPGLQVECEATQYRDVGGDRVDVVSLPACGTAPCWRFATDPQQCPTTASHAAIQIDRTGLPPPSPDTVVELRCRVRE